VATEVAADFELALASDGNGRDLCVYEMRAEGRTTIAARILRGSAPREAGFSILPG
jgi:hypothetical protein